MKAVRMPATVRITGTHLSHTGKRYMCEQSPQTHARNVTADFLLQAGLVYLSSVYDKLGWSPDDNVRYSQILTSCSILTFPPSQMYPLSAERELLVSSDGRILLDPTCFRLDRLPNTIIHDDGVRPVYSGNG